MECLFVLMDFEEDVDEPERDDTMSINADLSKLSKFGFCKLLIDLLSL